MSTGKSKSDNLQAEAMGRARWGCPKALLWISSASFPKRQLPPRALASWDEQGELSLHWAGKEERDEAGAQGCPFPAWAAPRCCRPPLSWQPRPTRIRKQEEGGRPVRRNNGAGQLHH